jgi:hypothetical protein
MQLAGARATDRREREREREAKFRVGFGSSELGIKKVTAPMLAGTVFGRSR